MVKVCNLVQINNPPFGEDGDLLCDRSTSWGNPFIMYYQSQRDEVCDKFEKYFRIMQTDMTKEEKIAALQSETTMTHNEALEWIIKTGGKLDISEIKGAKRLFCHCAPLRCHCDYLKKLIEAIEDTEFVPEKKENDLSEFGF